jgi:hypothetical protein
LYCHVLADIEEHQVLALKALHMLVAATTPLTLLELRFALAVDLSHLTLQSVEDESDLSIERTIRLTLGSLVRICGIAPRQTVHLFHQSTKQFLIRLSGGKVETLNTFNSDLRGLYGVDPAIANLEMSTACIAFLNLEEFGDTRILDENASAFDALPGGGGFSLFDGDDEQPTGAQESTESEKPPFFDYSASNWAFHLAEAGNAAVSQRPLLEAAIHLSKTNSNQLINWSDCYRSSSNE